MERCSLEEKLIVTGSFTSLVALEHQHPHAAELCGYLSIIKFIFWIASKHKSSGLKVSIVTDSSSVINRLVCTLTVTSFSISMHQVLKEIRKITSNLGIKLHVFKIKADQEDMRNFSDLSFAERENFACDLAAKVLICNADSETCSLPCDLSSTHLSTTHDQIISAPASLCHHASLAFASQFFEHKLKISRVDTVDWTSRIIAFEKFSTHLHRWASKSLSNFAGTAHRMDQCGLWEQFE